LQIDYGELAYGELAHMANRLWQIGIWQKGVWQNVVFPCDLIRVSTKKCPLGVTRLLNDKICKAFYKKTRDNLTASKLTDIYCLFCLSEVTKGQVQDKKEI